MATRTIKLPVGRDEIEMDLYASSGEACDSISRCCIVIVPGATNKNWPPYQPVCADIAESIAAAGFDCVAFAARGQQPCTGQWSHESLEEDLAAVVDYVEQDSPASLSIGLLALSAGTSPALSFACRYPDRVKCLAFWGTCFRGFYDAFYADLNRAKEVLSEYQTVLREDFSIPERLYPEVLLPRLQVPLLLGFGTKDQHSSMQEHCEALRSCGTNNVSLVIMKDTPHSVHRKHHSFQQYANTMVSWFSAWLSDGDLRVALRHHLEAPGRARST
jgi:pimeloyl-ACP methyl ester carboxylesterase